MPNETITIKLDVPPDLLRQRWFLFVREADKNWRKLRRVWPDAEGKCIISKPHKKFRWIRIGTTF